MNYIVFDLEFNQGYNFKKENKTTINLKCPFEIIQIGALKLNKNFEIISTFDKLIRPELYTTMHPFVKEMTSLTMDDLNNAKCFKEVYEEFIDFVKDNKSVLCVWGMADIKELFRNIEYHNLNSDLIPKDYINLQHYTSRFLNYSKGVNIGLRNAVEFFDITINNEFHNAFNDAYYTSEILKKVYSKEIKPNVYSPYKRTRINKPKKNIDTHKLITQFEKMFNREMSCDEIKIIKLAYIMGKTNQFQIENTENKKI